MPRLVEDHFVDTVADSSGPVPVSLVDAKGFEPGQHGQRVTDNFLANTRRSRLVQIEGYGKYELDGVLVGGINSRGYIRHALASGGGIFFTSTDQSPLYSEATSSRWFLERGRPFFKEARAFAAWMQDQNTLFVASLENPSGLGVGKGGVYCDDFAPKADGSWIPPCGALDDYIAHSGVGLNKTLFAGAIDPHGVARAAIRGDGVFADHVIYVESVDGTTSMAAPVLAAYATNLAFSNPGWDAVRLRRELMRLAAEEQLDHDTGGSNDLGQRITERRVVKVIRPASGRRGEPLPDPAPEPDYTDCEPTAAQIAFSHGYEVSACFEYEESGETVRMDAVDYGLDSGQSGLLYFFDRDNAEVLVKVLDACAVNGHRWVFVAPVTDLALNLEVREVATGKRWRYRNPRGGQTARPRSDTAAFPCDATAASWAIGNGSPDPRPSGGASLVAAGVAEPVTERQVVRAGLRASSGDATHCEPGTPALTLHGGYTVRMCYETSEGGMGDAVDWGLDSRQSALLYFFDRDNVEVLLKVLDGCRVNGHHWVFVAPVTDLAFNLVVESPSGQRWTHSNRLGQTADAASDTSAFPCAS